MSTKNFPDIFGCRQKTKRKPSKIRKNTKIRIWYIRISHTHFPTKTAQKPPLIALNPQFVCTSRSLSKACTIVVRSPPGVYALTTSAMINIDLNDVLSTCCRQRHQNLVDMSTTIFFVDNSLSKHWNRELIWCLVDMLSTTTSNLADMSTAALLANV